MPMLNVQPPVFSHLAVVSSVRPWQVKTGRRFLPQARTLSYPFLSPWTRRLPSLLLPSFRSKARLRSSQVQPEVRTRVLPTLSFFFASQLGRSFIDSMLFFISSSVIFFFFLNPGPNLFRHWRRMRDSARRGRSFRLPGSAPTFRKHTP